MFRLVSLHHHVQSASSSSIYPYENLPAEDAFDGNEATLFHSGVTENPGMETHWLKVCLLFISLW